VNSYLYNYSTADDDDDDEFVWSVSSTAHSKDFAYV